MQKPVKIAMMYEVCDVTEREVGREEYEDKEDSD